MVKLILLRSYSPMDIREFLVIKKRNIPPLFKPDLTLFISSLRKQRREAIWWKLFCVTFFVKIKFTKLPRAFNERAIPNWETYLWIVCGFKKKMGEFKKDLIMISHKTTGSSSKFSQSRIRNKNPDYNMFLPQSLCILC